MASARPKRWHVAPKPGRGWAVRRETATSASVVKPTQAEALRAAREIARRQGGGEVVVHRPDGRIRGSDTVPRANDPYPPRDQT
ncbi:MAG: DUF2188 domain-containing protein [bacterium]|nr:DUF2188 domain-containing protein [bacterium]MCY3926035.1 DUF2188 domain-containing protein [bacterium]